MQSTTLLDLSEQPPTLLDLPDEVLTEVARRLEMPSRDEYVDQLLTLLGQNAALASNCFGAEAAREQQKLERTPFRPTGQRDLQAFRLTCRQVRRLVDGDGDLAAKALYSIRRVPVQKSSWSARGDVRGGGTGREFVHNLGIDGKLPWNKWYDASAPGSSWVQASLGRPARLVGYALMSGNDCPHRDPVDWEVTSMSSGGEPLVLHKVEGHDFARRYEWAVGRLPGKEVGNVGVRITKARGGRDIQLSQVLLLEEVLP